MNYITAAILGIVQGVAEFLPISSSGHLCLFETLFSGLGLAELDNNPLFNVMLHLGTLAAVIVAYWPDVRDMLVELWRMVTGQCKRTGIAPNVPMRRQILMMIIATLPLFLVVPVHSQIQSLGSDPRIVGLMLILTGSMLFVSDHMPKGERKDEKNMTVGDALIVGLCQAVATIPGISRSGATITAGLSRRFDRAFAVKFSFLLSLLSVAGAVGLNVLDVIIDGTDFSMLPACLLGMVIAGVVGYACLKLLQRIVDKGRFGGFAYYCWGVGLLTVIVSFLRG